MSILARCECGHRMMVADVMGGRTVRCSNCSGEIDVPNAPVAGRGTTSAAPKKKPGDGPVLIISPALIITASVTAVLLIVLLALYFGPWKVGKQWEAMSPNANDQVTSVVDFAIRAYESNNGMYDAAHSHHAPAVEGKATFIPPMMVFSMPRRISFYGATNQGGYIGTYDTTNGEVAADIEVGGMTVAGLISTKKATGQFRATGRVKDGNPEAEVNGQPLHIFMRKIEGRE